MSRVITFSRTFPAYHSRAGQPTHFIQKIWKGLGGVASEYTLPFVSANLNNDIVWGYQMIEGYKYHTIRAGNRWKAGDKFSPRVWSGKPYNSKMITIGPDIEIKKIWDIKIDRGGFYINGRCYDGEIESHHELLESIAANDGLSSSDLLKWFKYPAKFQGQIICWNESIEY
jgi:hypothetical protein